MKNMNFLFRVTSIFTACVCSAAYAQSSVTLYGVLDNGLNFTSNAGGHRAYAMVSGDTSETSFGLKGTEDLGGGISAIFTLENGSNLNSGQLNEGGRIFGRQAFLGLTSDPMGTLTLGRQYDATIDMWSPFTAAGSSIGDFAAHPFDNDNADYDFRLSNSAKYVSPTVYGFQAEITYGFSNATNFAANRAYSAGVTYGAGPLSLALAYLRMNDPGTTSSGAVTSDAVFTASKQQNFAFGAKWTFSENANVALTYSHVDVTAPTANAYAPDIGTQAWTSWKFDNIEVNGTYFLSSALSLVGSYAFTHGQLESTSGSNSPNWHQIAFMMNYSLSKRTSLYVQGAWQHTNARTGTNFDGAYIVGSSGISSSGNQMTARVGLTQKF
jgi:predicted porin